MRYEANRSNSSFTPPEQRNGVLVRANRERRYKRSRKIHRTGHPGHRQDRQEDILQEGHEPLGRVTEEGTDAIRRETNP